MDASFFAYMPLCEAAKLLAMNGKEKYM